MMRPVAFAAALLLAGCATVPGSAPAAPDHPEARAYAVSDSAMGDVETMRSWRNAASRSKDAIYAELERFAPPPG